MEPSKKIARLEEKPRETEKLGRPENEENTSSSSETISDAPKDTDSAILRYEEMENIAMEYPFMLARLPMPIPAFSLRTEEDKERGLEEKDTPQLGASGPEDARQSPDALESGATGIDPGLSVIPLEAGEEKPQDKPQKCGELETEDSGLDFSVSIEPFLTSSEGDFLHPPYSRLYVKGDAGQFEMEDSTYAESAESIPDLMTHSTEPSCPVSRMEYSDDESYSLSHADVRVKEGDSDLARRFERDPQMLQMTSSINESNSELITDDTELEEKRAENELRNPNEPNELKHEVSGNGNGLPQARKTTDDQLVELTADEKHDIGVEFDTLGKHDPDKSLVSENLKTKPTSSAEVAGSSTDRKKIQNAGYEIPKAKQSMSTENIDVTGDGDDSPGEDLPSLKLKKYPGESAQDSKFPEGSDTSHSETGITDRTKINNEDEELNDSTKQNTSVNAAKSDPIQSFSDEFNTQTDATNADSKNKDVDTDGFHVQQGQERFIVGKQCTPTVSSSSIRGPCDMDLNTDTMGEDRTKSTAGQIGGADKDASDNSADEGIPFGRMDKPRKIDQLESERVSGDHIQVPDGNRLQPPKQHELREDGHGVAAPRGILPVETPDLSRAPLISSAESPQRSSPPPAVSSNTLDADEDAQLQSFDNVYNTTEHDNNLATGKPFLSATPSTSSAPEQIDKSRLKSDISQQKCNIQDRDASTTTFVHHIDAVTHGNNYPRYHGYLSR